jgi:hypothetical protein
MSRGKTGENTTAAVQTQGPRFEHDGGDSNKATIRT